MNSIITPKPCCIINTSRPHIVHVVSMLDVPNKFGSTSFQSKDVSGAQKSEFLFCENKEITIHYFPECNRKLQSIKRVHSCTHVVVLNHQLMKKESIRSLSNKWTKSKCIYMYIVQQSFENCFLKKSTQKINNF